MAQSTGRVFKMVRIGLDGVVGYAVGYEDLVAGCAGCVGGLRGLICSLFRGREGSCMRER